ncbi:protein translocase subunit SecD [Amedibacterium intestinale]|uniref:protein translocase subunit SecD n=1 Tax=Amedibacterium intestinale TaxID=2583452 RepID=UPI000E4A9921|nr:protein translocase subunit SecD [Amedibacterium intestinale]RHO34169.1 protein translocase subunit SecD [Erysipelotrichaceae bacterium AM17-60]
MKKSRFIVFGITVVTIFAIIAASFGSVKDGMKMGLDLQGGFEILYEVSPLEGKDMPDMSAVAESVNKRVDVLGVNEPEITVEGNNRIRVQLAGVKNADQARRVISSTANLTFRDVNDNLLMDASVLKEGSASVGYDEYGNPLVNLKLADQKKFYEVTKEVASKSEGENLMVAWLDFDEKTDSYAKEANAENPKFISAARVQEGINSTSAQISGNFTKEEAKELSDLINSGSLPVKMTEIYSDSVTADYGTDAFSVTMFAGAVGIGLIMLFMILYYRLPGVISAVTIAAYVFVVFVLYNLMGAVFTLSGIAALVLGVGMAVDSNILTFERIRDALYSGRSVRTAFYEGSSKSFITIFDAQVTTFISALILFEFGKGSVKGFATMLMVSTITTLLLIVFIAKFLLKQLVESGWLDDKRSWFGVKESNIPDVSKGQERFYFGRFKGFDFVGKAKYFIFTSLAVLVIGAGCMTFNGVKGNGIFNFGIDFTSGTKITVQSDTPIDKSTLNNQLKDLGIQANSIKINGENNQNATVFVKDAIKTEKMDTVKAELKKTYKHDVNENTVTPVIGKELVQNAVLISILAWIGVMIYISVRFKWDYALSGIVALVHDVFIILAFCAIFRLEVNTEIIAVMLAIIGYSINNSIVVFDRIRDQVKERRHETLNAVTYREIVNVALQNTATRSILSTFTTVLPVFCLLGFGSNAIFTFCLALCIGLLAGAGSSLFIAAQLWYQIRIHEKPKKAKKHKPRKKEEKEEMIVPGLNDY